jgi:hypothetical protein
MSERRLSRRGFFSLFRAPEPKAPAQPAKPPPKEVDSGTSAFLDAFYRPREKELRGGEALPIFPMRPGLPDPRPLNTTVGVPELDPPGERHRARRAEDEPEDPNGIV